ncbi:hypothetical protein B0H10DRAFT_1947771 [Mycena sp. CBHHK59/15]|nr:hypothetical protein B0H10DRAFT_1947771 [Mycena sp. CBHHK59/15]
MQSRQAKANRQGCTAQTALRAKHGTPMQDGPKPPTPRVPRPALDASHHTDPIAPDSTDALPTDTLTLTLVFLLLEQALTILTRGPLGRGREGGHPARPTRCRSASRVAPSGQWPRQSISLESEVEIQSVGIHKCTVNVSGQVLVEVKLAVTMMLDPHPTAVYACTHPLVRRYHSPANAHGGGPRSDCRGQKSARSQPHVLRAASSANIGTCLLIAGGAGGRERYVFAGVVACAMAISALYTSRPERIVGNGPGGARQDALRRRAAVGHRVERLFAGERLIELGAGGVRWTCAVIERDGTENGYLWRFTGARVKVEWDSVRSEFDIMSLFADAELSLIHSIDLGASA